MKSVQKAHLIWRVVKLQGSDFLASTACRDFQLIITFITISRFQIYISVFWSFFDKLFDNSIEFCIKKLFIYILNFKNIFEFFSQYAHFDYLFNKI